MKNLINSRKSLCNFGIGCILLIYLTSTIVEPLDNLALLSGTLRTFQQAGCDDNLVTLKCPLGTTISVELAQYGKATPHNQLCPSKTSDDSLNKANVTCLWPTAHQNKWDKMTKGTWVRTVVEACQKKSNCKFQASPKTFGGDPCPGERKYVEVAYKCRPYEFRSRVACEDDHIQLQCNSHSRIAVYSASYGRTEYESFQCPQPQGVAEETCLMSYTTETVMKHCHGRIFCDFSVNASIFGPSSPCRPQTRMYLRVVYTCVPQKVLNKQYEYKGLLEDNKDLDTAANINYEQDDFVSLDSGFSSSSSIETKLNERIMKTQNYPGSSSSSSIGNHIKFEQGHNYFLYMTIGIGVAILLLMIIFGVSLLVQKLKAFKNGFDEMEISEVDDIDLGMQTNLPISGSISGILSQSSPALVEEVSDFMRYPYVHPHFHGNSYHTNTTDTNTNTNCNSGYFYG